MRTGEVGQEKKQTETKQKEALNRVQSWLNVRKVSYCEAPAVKMAAVAWHIEKQTYKYTVHVHVHIASVNQWPRSILEHKFYLLHCKHDVERRSRTQRAAVWCWHTLYQTDRINDNRETADVTWRTHLHNCNKPNFVTTLEWEERPIWCDTIWSSSKQILQVFDENIDCIRHDFVENYVRR